MRTLASIYCWFWVALMACLATVASVILFLPFNPLIDPTGRVMDRVNHYWARATLWGLPRISGEYVGLERARESREPYLVCANHQSVADVIVMLSAFPRGKFIVKRKMFFVPFFAIPLRLARYIQVTNENPESVLTETRKWLARGVPVLNFPEGSRSPDGKLQRFRKHLFAVACDLHVKILPVAIARTRDVITKGSLQYNMGTCGYLEVLEPIEAVGDPGELARATKKRIQDAIDALAARTAPNADVSARMPEPGLTAPGP